MSRPMTTLPALMPEARFWQLMTHIDRPLLLSGQDDEPLRAALTHCPLMTSLPLPCGWPTGWRPC